uniref:Ig-like domain-containing protein n=1 Tax=Sinocyclocheilus anshuiensis TaxID=1608454 RepID=A0A671RW03_9TELE
LSNMILKKTKQTNRNTSDVVQEPILWKAKGSSAVMNCKQNKRLNIQRMYWYRQRQGQTMRLIAFTTSFTEPEYGDSELNKFMANKTTAESGALTVNNLQPNDSATYFCSVSEYTVYQTQGRAVQKNRCLKIRSKH